MASAHIELDQTTRLGGKLRRAVDNLTELRSDLAETKAVYDQLALGGDFDALGAALGLTGGTAATDAEAIYNLLGSVVTEQNASTFTIQFLSRLG
jgi:hypothetical protein